MRPIDPRLLRYARSSRRFLALAVIVGALTAGVVIVQAHVLSSIIVDVTANGATLDAVLPSIAVLAGVFIVRALLNWFAEVAAFRSAATAKQELRQAAAASILREGPYGPAGSTPGEVASLMTRGIDGLDAYYARYLPQLILAVIVPVAVLVSIIGADLLSTVIIAVTIPLIPLFMALIGMYTKSRVDRQWRVLGRLSGHFLDLVSGLPTLKAFGRAKDQERAIRAIGEEYRRSTMGVLRISFLSSLALELLATLSVALVAVSVGLRLAEGQMQYSTALFVLILAPEAYLPLRMVGQQFHAASEGLGAAERVFALIGDEAPAKPTPAEVTGRVAALGVTGLAVRFGDHQALAPVSFRAMAGQITALAGPSGSGKTTLLAAIMGFVPPSAGRVWLEADTTVDQADTAPDAWRAQFGWVPQRAHLVGADLGGRATLRDVITLGAPDASDTQVQDALRQAGIADEIAADGLGLARELSTDGSGISVGQSQRIGLARALVRAPQVLILDEPTAALDAASEQAVLMAIRAAADAGAVVLVVAHRPAMLAIADQVVTITGGVS
ncbi:MAG: thiol reductant ABC exporter subunit CydD [Candidatus Nanopelagicales bacterium]|nr:thiol reductant ABC exporter subunit CydD [Candidatus Nanopelagicales bacterium]